MPDKRCKTFTRTYVDYGMFGYRLYRLVVALSAFRKRTGARLSTWFGRLFEPD